MPPPPEVVADLMALEDWPLPRLDRVVGAPVFGADGSLDTEPGYHPGSSTFFAPSPGLTVPSVAANPSDANIANARNLLLDLLIDFPFVSPSERAHAIGLFLLPFCRDLIAGPTPLHLFEAPSPGTGKNLLVEVLLAPSLGPEVALMTEGRDEDEWRKRITSKLIAGTPALIIDNLQRKLDSPAVASVITAPVWEDRILGLSRMARIPVTTAFAATGNNPMLSGEISRRTVRCRLDAGVERPWLRKDFAQPQLRDWIASHRGELIAAALTMIAAWLARGSRLGERTLGMFEGWSGTVGGILETVGIDGFLENLDELYDTADIEYRALLALVEVWHAEFGGRAVGTAELWPLVGKIDPPVELGDGSERSRRTRFGRVLTSQRDRRLGNFRVVAAGQHRGARQWRLHDA